LLFYCIYILIPGSVQFFLPGIPVVVSLFFTVVLSKVAAAIFGHKFKDFIPVICHINAAINNVKKILDFA